MTHQIHWEGNQKLPFNDLSFQQEKKSENVFKNSKLHLETSCCSHLQWILKLTKFRNLNLDLSCLHLSSRGEFCKILMEKTFSFHKWNLLQNNGGGGYRVIIIHWPRVITVESEWQAHGFIWLLSLLLLKFFCRRTDISETWGNGTRRVQHDSRAPLHTGRNGANTCTRTCELRTQAGDLELTSHRKAGRQEDHVENLPISSE